MRRRQPLRDVRVRLAGPGEIAGTWRIDAAPVFTAGTGQFAGYHGRMRRPVPVPGLSAAHPNTLGDRMRFVLHELRTPVNAIQGFAELIQQQMFGSAPNEYRALAAAVAVDAARLMAGFDEIDRLAQLETGSLRLDEGECDLRDIIAGILRRLEGALRPRGARIELIARGLVFTVGMADPDAMQLVWRLLATLAGSLAPGEIVDLSLSSDGERITLDAGLPATLTVIDDLFAASVPSQPRAISAGMFGPGFTLRLARAETEASGGTLERRDDALRLVLPVLTAHPAAHTLDREGNGGSSVAQ
jgi:two-component system, OmpR family, sensor kinase